jgi:hypothetical protein
VVRENSLKLSIANANISNVICKSGWRAVPVLGPETGGHLSLAETSFPGALYDLLLPDVLNPPYKEIAGISSYINIALIYIYPMPTTISTYHIPKLLIDYFRSEYFSQLIVGVQKLCV